MTPPSFPSGSAGRTPQRRPSAPTSPKKTSLQQALERLRTAKAKGGLGAPLALLGAYVFFGLSFLAVVLFLGVYFVYLSDLPPISSLEQNTLAEASVIYDRSGKELYSFHNGEKRTYIPYESISPTMVHAIVSTEDKTFFENAGVDLLGIVRSGVNYLIGKTDRVQATSTISQQLIKNMFLGNERTLSRKIKEFYLSYAMNASFSKEKILEIYLNKIAFGSNAYGIEQASLTFFGKPASELGVLGSSILASLPKWPSLYSPYTHRELLMGAMKVKMGNSESVLVDTPTKFGQYWPFVSAFKAFATNLQFTPEGSSVRICGIDENALSSKPTISVRNGCTTLGFDQLFQLWSSVELSADRIPTLHGKVPVDMVMTYESGRKDLVLRRMFEDGHIKADEYKQAFVGGLEFTFKPYRENILHPHFVFYVRDYIEQQYGTGFLLQGGLKIYTSLDGNLQNKAEALVSSYAATNATKYGAKDAALVSVDNTSGEILAMVGGANYFDTNREGAQVNVVTSHRQPGSSFKPIVYSLALSKEPIGPETPIYDIKTSFGNWNPDNYDEKYMGRMPLKRALAYSRNIPAIKMLTAAGGEKAVVEYARSLGIESLNSNRFYGAPLAIGAGEVQPLEMVQAYSTFAGGGLKRELTPLLRIEDNRGNVLYQHRPDAGKRVLSDAAAYLISDILSTPENRPSGFWNNALSLKGGRTAAAKTGTSNMEVTINGQKTIRPRDLWTAGYTPFITTVVWSGNIDASATKPTCDGLNCAAPIWREFMDYAHAKLPNKGFVKPDSVVTATISRVSGRLVGTSSPESIRVTGEFAVAPTEYENSLKEVQVDLLCNGQVTDETPPEAIKKGFLMKTDPVIESLDASWLPGVRNYLKGSNSYAGADNIITQYSENTCDRPNKPGSVRITTNLQDGQLRSFGDNRVRVTYSSTYPLDHIEVLVDGAVVTTQPITSSDGTTELAFAADKTLAGSRTLQIKAYDTYFFSAQDTATVVFGNDSTPPEVTLTNPQEGDLYIRVYQDQFFNLRFSVSDSSPVTAVNVYLNDKPFRVLGGGKTDYAVSMNEDRNMDIGIYDVRVEALDGERNRASKEFKMEILAR